MKFLYKKINSIKKNPYWIFIMGFILIIFIGTILLSMPFASKNGTSVGFIDALFTATSATCVTGLAVVNTAEHWSYFGKIVIIALIQIGGLGVMSMTAMISIFFGKKISLKTRVLIMEERNVDELQGVVRLTKNILLYTFGIELIGAALLSIVFIKDYGFYKGIAFSLFHSISSFCNAGFDLTGNSMMKYTGNPIITITICGLFIVGGLGYFVFWDIYASKGYRRLTLHSKLVVIITVLLLIFGTLIVLVLEYNNQETLGKLNIFDKIQASFFQAATPRTAGFNSIPIESLKIPTALFVIILMFIGGSPASTAGGIKTTTLGIILISIYNLVRGKRDIEVFERRITPETALKAVAIAGISILLVNFVSIVLTITEAGTGFEYLDILFETVSAFATVGLTRGLTPLLSSAGKIILSVVMFIGRLGPLTIAYGILKQNKNIGNYTYPDGKIIIG